MYIKKTIATERVVTTTEILINNIDFILTFLSLQGVRFQYIGY
jgi:hypothetical protein